MPKVIIEDNKNAVRTKKVEMGDLIIIESAPYMVIKKEIKENICYCQLVDLESGNRWNDGSFPDGTEFGKIFDEHINTYSAYSYEKDAYHIKNKDYTIRISI